VTPRGVMQWGTISHLHCAALRDFDPSFVSSGSKTAFRPNAHMPASTGSGHEPVVSRCSKGGAKAKLIRSYDRRGRAAEAGT
jgi:hypothetical protein